VSRVKRAPRAILAKLATKVPLAQTALQARTEHAAQRAKLVIAVIPALLAKLALTAP
jgi:hypothetical protein